MDRVLTNAVLIDAWPGDVRACVVAGGRVTDFLVDRVSRPSIAGHIYRGRVTAVNGALNAAFVDIGTDRPGFLAAADAGGKGRISEHLTEGKSILVQVLADPTADAGGAKGAKLTRRITLPGRYCILTPGDGKVRLSRKIDDGAALKGLLDALKPDPDTGFVVRSRAASADAQVVTDEAQSLVKAWAHLTATDQKPPFLLHADDAVARALRLAPEGASVRLAGPQAATLRARLGFGEVQSDSADLFADHDVDEDWQAALSTAVALAGGGTLTIERTAAVVAIDVNVGGGKTLDVNLAAACEIARHIRLRSLGGLFVVDFARTKNKTDRARVLAALRTAVADDPESVQVAGETTFGLIEMTRPRRRPDLVTVLGRDGETAAFDSLRAVLADVRARPGHAPALTCAPDVATALDGPAAAAQAALEDRLGRPVDIRVDAAMLPGTFTVG